jgi:predicted PhzF superfamily epimerase YddE/YHI9
MISTWLVMIVYWADTLTSTPFGGKPAAVCLLGEAPADDAWMQQVAAELNQPTTAFLLSDPLLVEQARSDFGAIRQLPVTRVIVTAPGGEGADFTSRVFVPKIGLDEDQVTGSAHAVLGPLWAARQGSTQLTAVQASRRRGTVAIAVHGDRVHIGGSATILGTGNSPPADTAYRANPMRAA